MAQYDPYLGDMGLSFDSPLPFTEIVYSDPDFGQRFDVYLYNSQDPYYSTILFENNNGTNVNMFLVHKYNDMNLQEPVCFISKTEFTQPISFTLARKLSLGTVLNESTINYVDNNFNWIQVVNNTRGRYYPRSISNVYYAGVFTDFETVVPYEEAWEVPTCFPNYPVKRAIAPPVAPIPSGFSLTVVADDYIGTYYTDSQQKFFRSDITFPASAHYPALTLTNINRGNMSYVSVNWIPIQPVACVYIKNTYPYDVTFGGVYHGTHDMGNATDPRLFNFYGFDGIDVYTAFDHKTNNLEVIYYQGEDPVYVSNWVPQAPPASVWTVPTGCFLVPNMFKGAETPNPLAPTFPSTMTIYVFDGQNEIIFYYDGPNKMWRIDSPFMTQIQKGTTNYMFLKSSNPSGSIISPLPCYQFTQPWTFIPDLAPSFSQSLGTATVNGVATTVWYGQGQMWYWDNTNTPRFFFDGPIPNVVSYFQPGPPPPGVFDPPTFCITGTPIGLSETNSIRKSRPIPFASPLHKK